jgi:hypothetical protein
MKIREVQRLKSHNLRQGEALATRPLVLTPVVGDAERQ